ncbi:DUF11 domain-containing protein, partial [Phyllobacterium phragmitis]|uniref:DUF7933 domain-containing protein n=1 Tax=Phyllobacterium phragmitis TaxID=2670329 RepID=UPI001304D048
MSLSKPIIAPILHVWNLGPSRLTIGGTSTTGSAIGLQVVARNSTMDISGTTLNNQVLQDVGFTGCLDSTGATAHESCGSVRLTGGPISALTFDNNAIPPSASANRDGWWWTVSFPTAPLTKQFSPATIAAGETSQLTFSITNPNETASVTLTPLAFTDNLPAGVTLASATATNNGSCGSPTVGNGAGGALAVGATSVGATNISVVPGATCTITVDVTSTVVGSYTNDATNMSTSVGNLVPGSSTTLTVTEPLDVDLSITKDDGVTTYTPGLDTTYTIVVSNIGPDDVTGAQITDPLPMGVTQANWTCGGATGGAVCGAPSGTGAIDTTADLPSGASVTYTLGIGIPGSYSGSLTNTATVTAPDGATDSNTTNNTASDTDTMEAPPVSGACSPREVAPGAAFSLAPFANGGSVVKTGTGAWGTGTTSEWYKLGGNYTLQWNFTQPIPAEWLQFMLIDIDPISPNGTLTIELGGGVSTGQIVKIDGDLLLGAGGVVRRNGAITDDPGQSATFRFAPGSGTLTWIRITSANIAASDNIGNRLQARPSCLTVQKISEGDTGSFEFDMTNVVQADGTAVPSTTLTTTAEGTPVSSPAYNA